MKNRFYALVVLSVFCWGSVAFAKQTPPKPAAKLDPRAATVFERAIKRYKQFKSLHIEANEMISGGGTPARIRYYSANLQMPLRARLDIAESDISGKNKHPISRQIVGEKQYVTWQPGTGEAHQEIKSSAQRNAAITTVFKSSPLMALSVASFCGGVNPAKMPIVQKAAFNMDSEDEEKFEVVQLTVLESADGKTATLSYYFSPTTHLLRMLILTREHSNSIQLLSIEFKIHKENSEANQSDTDSHVYSWESTIR